ncbi:hypothetical protein GCM10008959_19250 [Deinococcus seoulensis]|uniref:DUF418 domain-containing protein n=1 Tax=Deinococcus seoulensis TaxID=1837379 RepID=A0ABQ2RUU2_9DEIO|nr:DUF418 domain-containing protein [Deinococcus seoulensis]GGR57617.1 hypothetical protein GCM10008959_19250 [Deinococcus seoulensis]
MTDPAPSADPAAAPLPPDATVPQGPQRGPVQDRSPLPDVLRGLSLLGILVVNMQDFAGFLEWRQSGLDRAAQVVTDVLANGRFISIFAMLFGWGAAGLLARHGAGVFLRRHAALLLLGAAHFVLVWHGDIISLYALVGLGMLATVRMNTRTLLVMAGVLGTWYLGLDLLSALASRGEAGTRWSGLPDLGGTYAGNVAARAAEFSPELLGSALFNGPWLLALFCLGAAAQRSGLLLRPHEHTRTLRGLAVGGLGLGLPLGALLAYLNTRPEYAAGALALPVRMGGGLASALGYVGVIGLLAARGRLGWLRPLAASGRTAMSNYLTQSLLMTALFYPYAGAQFGRWGAAAGLALSLTVGLAQVPLSAWWLARFGQGPLEGLVRRVVYGPRVRQNRAHD